MTTTNEKRRGDLSRLRKLGCLLALGGGLLWAVSDAAIVWAQDAPPAPPADAPNWENGGPDGRPGGRDGERGPGRGDRGGRGGRRGGDSNNDKGGKDAKDSKDGQNAPNAPGAQNGGGPGGGRAGGPGAPGAPNGGPNGQNPDGKDGKDAKDDPSKQREVNLDEALEKSSPTAPIRLNQASFTTQDGVRLVGVFYKGAATGPDATPVILLHGREGNKEQYESLAKKLAEQGCAVLVPDLRGCGESTRRSVADFSRGNMPTKRDGAEYLMKNFNNSDLRAAIEYDKQVWFNFLIYLHNKEMLNVKKTVIVGSELGAALAAAWAKADWNEKSDLGQNVVGLALLSPDAITKADKSSKAEKKTGKDKKDANEAGSAAQPVAKFDALASLEALRRKSKGKDACGYIVFVGSLNETKLNDAQTIQKELGGKAEEELAPEEKTVPIVALKTEKEGVDLLTVESFGVDATIAQFIARQMRSLSKKRQKWEAIDLEKAYRR